MLAHVEQPHLHYLRYFNLRIGISVLFGGKRLNSVPLLIDE
jgi:hypothetical protein